MLFLAQIVGAAGAFVTTLAIARVLGPEGRGVFALVTTLAALMAIVGQMGLGAAMTYLIAADPDRQRRVAATFLANAVAGTAIVGATITALLSMTGVFPEAIAGYLRLAPAMLAIAVTVFDGANTYQAARLQFSVSARTLACVNLAPAMVVVTLALTGSLTQSRALIAWGAARAVVGTAVWILAATGMPSAQAEAVGRTMRAFGRRALPASLAGVVTLRSDQWILGILAGPAPLGVYAVAVSMSDPIVFAASAVQRVLFPTVARDPTRAGVSTARAVRRLMPVLAFLTAIIAPVGYLAIPAVFGEDFAGSRTPFLIVLTGGPGFALLAVCSASISAIGRPGRASVVELAAGATMIALDFALIPDYGPTGAAIAAAISYNVGGVLAVGVLRRQAPFRLRELIPTMTDARAAAQRARRSGI